MNFWSLLLTVALVWTGWQLWQAQTLFKVHWNAQEAWERTSDLLRQRRDFAHQVVLFCDETGFWHHETMERLLRASRAVVEAETQEQRMQAERGLGSALRHTMGVLAKTAPRGDTEDLHLMATYWTSTERKIDFARRYYNSAAEAANRRLDTRLAKAMVRTRAVRRHAVFHHEDASGTGVG